MCVLHSSNDYYNSEAYRILHQGVLQSNLEFVFCAYAFWPPGAILLEQGEFTLRLYDSILKRSNCNVYNE